MIEVYIREDINLPGFAKVRPELGQVHKLSELYKTITFYKTWLALSQIILSRLTASTL